MSAAVSRASYHVVTSPASFVTTFTSASTQNAAFARTSVGTSSGSRPVSRVKRTVPPATSSVPFPAQMRSSGIVSVPAPALRSVPSISNVSPCTASSPFVPTSATSPVSTTCTPAAAKTSATAANAANLHPPKRAGIVTFISFISFFLPHETFSSPHILPKTCGSCLYMRVKKVYNRLLSTTDRRIAA